MTKPDGCALDAADEALVQIVDMAWPRRSASVDLAWRAIRDVPSAASGPDVERDLNAEAAEAAGATGETIAAFALADR